MIVERIIHTSFQNIRGLKKISPNDVNILNLCAHSLGKIVFRNTNDRCFDVYSNNPHLLTLKWSHLMQPLRI